MSQQKYDEMLASLIPNLNQFSFKRGGEGRVYFVDENFVVKRYSPKTKSIDGSFEKYCKEMQNFYELGLSVPRIYSYANISDMSSPFCGLYFLEERVKGRELFFNGEIERAYEICKHFCSKKEFVEAVKSKKGELFELIVYTYLNDFYSTNSSLENVKIDVVENLILSDFDMLESGKYSLPDVQPFNIFFDGKNLTLIDNLYLETPRKHQKSDEPYNKERVLRDVADIFRPNATIFEYVKNNLKVAGSERILTLLEKNRAACGRLLKTFVRKTNNLLSPKFTSSLYFDSFKDAITNAAGEKDAKDILSEVQRNY